LFSGIKRPNEEIATQNIFLTAEEITTFQGRRPDRLAFDAKGKQCVFQEFTRTMNSVSSSDEKDWPEQKELEKNERYGLHHYFINHLSALTVRPWNCSQINFTVGACALLGRSNFKKDFTFWG